MLKALAQTSNEERYIDFTRKTRYDYGGWLLGAPWQWLNISYWYTCTRSCFGYNSDTVFCNSLPVLECARTDRHGKGPACLEANVNDKFGSGHGLLHRDVRQRIKRFSKLSFSDLKAGLNKTFDKDWTSEANPK